MTLLTYTSDGNLNLAEFIVRNEDDILTTISPINHIIPFRFDSPEEFDNFIYWSWINDQIVPRVDQFVSDNNENSINLIYIGNNDNSPDTLYQYLAEFFRTSDFDLSNTRDQIYER